MGNTGIQTRRLQGSKHKKPAPRRQLLLHHPAVTSNKLRKAKLLTEYYAKVGSHVPFKTSHQNGSQQDRVSGVSTKSRIQLLSPKDEKTMKNRKTLKRDGCRGAAKRAFKTDPEINHRSLPTPHLPSHPRSHRELSKENPKNIFCVSLKMLDA